MWYFDNHTRCENLHTLEALQERDSCRHYKTLAGRPAQTPAGLTEGLSLIREDGRNALAAAYTRVSQNRRAARETRPKEGWALAQESKMYANGADDQRDKKDEQDERAGGVFGDLSFAQILASALAAGVSFSLSSQIGVAGSLIGACGKRHDARALAYARDRCRLFQDWENVKLPVWLNRRGGPAHHRFRRHRRTGRAA